MSGESSVPSPAAVRTVIAAVLVRPTLWLTAMGAVSRLAAPGWWRRRPFLPLPDSRLWGFRMVTAYGRPDATPDADDVVAYLEWCRSAGGSRRERSSNRPSTARHG
ncbi:MAG: hypothetical protein ACRDWB_05795 [Acidimicrobiales bacterium]